MQIRPANGKTPDAATNLPLLALRVSESRYRRLFETARDGILLLNATTGQIEDVNPYLIKMLGYSHAEFLGKKLWEVGTFADIAQCKVMFHELQTNGYIRYKDLPLKTRAGAQVAVEFVSNSYDCEGTTVIQCNIRDITERKQAEEKLRRLNRVSKVSSGINTLILHVRTRQELFDGACRIAVEHGKFEITWIGTLDPATQDVTPVAWAGENAEALTRGKSSAREDTPRGKGAVGQAIRERRTVFNNDITAHGFGGPRMKEILRLGYQSQITLPLFDDQTVTGTLTMYARETNFFDAEELGLLTELASNISFALAHIAKEKKIARLSRIQAVMSNINSMIVRVSDRQKLFEEACRIAVEYGGFAMAWIGTLNQDADNLTAVAWSGLDAQSFARIPGSGMNMVADVRREKRAMFRNNLADGPAAGNPRRVEAVRRGYRSYIVLPLLQEDTVVAVVLLYTRDENFFTEEELALLNELAGDVSFALDHLEKQARLDYVAYYDALTGLPNRNLFHNRLSHSLHVRGGEQQIVTMVLLDLERFRQVNETLGRGCGDELLRAVGSRLVRANDSAARIGMDMYGLILRGARTAAEVNRALEAILAACFSEPFVLGGEELRIACRAGVALYPGDGADADALLRNAEAALRRSKRSAERIVFYAPEMNARVAEALAIETRLRRAVERREFVLHYQPKISLASGRITGLEALIRWQDPGKGLIPPVHFIPMLEETGMIIEVGRWVVEQAFTDLRAWSARGIGVPRVAVNVSALQLQRSDFVESMVEEIRRNGNSPQWLELEITESVVMDNVKENTRKLSILRGMGVTVAIDDFGTGYSSLSYLGKLPLDALKIDRSFVSGMTDSDEAASIVSTIITLAHGLKLKVVAEGVETVAQSNMLKRLRCDEAQGYLFSKPVPREIIETILLAPPCAGPALQGAG